MTERPMGDSERLYCLVPEDGAAIGNKALREKLKWSQERYHRARHELLEAGWIRLGQGRGGSVRRVQGEAQQLLAHIPLDGEPRSNSRVRSALGWKDEQYWRVRNELIDQGVLARGGGRGGSVFRVIEEDGEEELNDDAADPVRVAGKTYKRELDLYDSIKTALDNGWAMDKNFDDFFVETTAHIRNRSGGGKWSNPDLTVVSQRRLKLTGQRVLDIHTFEVKLGGAWDITAIYEALGHGRWATYSYALLHYYQLDKRSERILADCEKEARRHGVGLIKTANPLSYEDWDILVEPKRNNVDPDQLEEFLTRLPDERHQTLRRWSR